MNKITLYISMCMAALIAAGTTARADTEFTYQGELKDNGGPANGSFNMSFSLWDARVGGSQLDQTTPLGGVQVVAGKFSVELDFGASEFDNSNRWLEIVVEGVTLSPRHPITRAPYAIQTRGIFVDENKNVGIGTTSPAANLHIVGGQGTLRLDGDAADSFSEFKDATSQQLRINKTNNAGPVLLDLNPKAENGTSDVQVRFFRETNTTGPKSVQFLRGDFSTNASARIGVDGADSFFQAHGGNVGIGTTSPTESLDVMGVVEASRFQLEDANDVHTQISSASQHTLIGNFVGGDILLNTGTNPPFAATRLIVKNNGKVGIFTTEPEFDLHVSGSAGKPGGGSWSNSSDRRLKKNIKPLVDALGQLLGLRGVTFEYIDPEDIHELPGVRIGMVAQDVEQIVPDWVETREDGYMTVTYRGFEALTVEALRELRDENDAEIAALRAENDAMRTRLDSVEALVEKIAKPDSP